MADVLDFLTSQTSAVLRRVYEQPFAPLDMEMTGYAPMPQDWENYMPGATQFVLTSVEDFGEGAETNIKGTVFFTVGTIGEDLTIPVASWVAVATYTEQMVRQSMMLNRNLPDQEMRSGVRAIRRRHDRRAFRGEGNATYSFARDNNVVQQANLGTKWTDAAVDGDTLYDAMADFATSVNVNSKGVYTANRIACTLGVYNKCMTARIGDTGDTVARALMDNLGVMVVGIYGLKDSADAGQDGRAIAYAIDPDAGRNLLLMPPTPSPVIPGIKKYECGIEGQSGGFVWVAPTAARYQDNTG